MRLHSWQLMQLMCARLMLQMMLHRMMVLLLRMHLGEGTARMFVFGDVAVSTGHGRGRNENAGMVEQLGHPQCHAIVLFVATADEQLLLVGNQFVTG